MTLPASAASAALSAGLPALGGLFTGLASGNLSAEAQKEAYALAKRNLANAEAQQADVLSRQTQTNPLRDQTIFNLSKMLGAAPQSFNPVNFAAPTNVGPQGAGGTDLNSLASQMGTYTPGAGGVTSNVQQMILNRLGYGNTGTGTLFDTGSPNTSPPPTPPDQLTGLPGAAQTTGATIPGGGTPSGQGGSSAAPPVAPPAPITPPPKPPVTTPASPPMFSTAGPTPAPATPTPAGLPGTPLAPTPASSPQALAAQKALLFSRLGASPNLGMA